MKFNGICLNTDNVRILAEFYVKALGADADINDWHVELKTQGAGIVIFSNIGMEEMAPGSMVGAGAGGVTLMLEVEDVDGEYERIRRLGAEIVMPPKTHPWGARSFWFKDPDGNIVDFYAAAKG